MQDHVPNYRFLSRSAKLRNAEEIFSCQCGKSYLSFPSLYLHFQKKHLMMISTKESTSIRRIKKQRGKTITTYYFSKKHQQKGNATKLNENYLETGGENKQSQIENELFFLRRIIDQYVIQIKTEKKDKFEEQILQQTLDKIHYYLMQQILKKEEGIFCQIQSFKVSQLPYVFNSFIMDQTANFKCDFNDRRIIQICSILRGLANWMKQKNYTPLMVQYQMYEK